MLLTAAAIFGLRLLVERADASRTAQLSVGSLRFTVTDLLAAPFSADPAFNSGPNARSPRLSTEVAHRIDADKQRIATGLSAALRAGGSQEAVAEGRASLAEVTPVAEAVFRLASAPGGLAAAGGANVAAVQKLLTHRLGGLSTVIGQLERADSAQAERARTQAGAGIVIALLALLGVFGFFYFRSERLGRENEDLLGLSREDASTDALTGLGNRRALMLALAAAVDVPQEPHELLVSIFDLNGFKQYNDTFGHAAGDVLLTRLGGRLSAASAATGSAYRMGGDEFCVLARCAPDCAEALLDDALSALSDAGEGWKIDSSHGSVWMPSEADSSSHALEVADERMYANKAGRSSAGRQITDVLLQVLREQDKGLNTHGDDVAALAGRVAESLELPDHEVGRIRLAASLHDIGKTAIPESILNKPGPLDEQDWEFMHRHTQIGERIVLAAPALASTAPLIRSSHERVDGSGYPDALPSDQIPLGSRIIAACDAFDAMTTKRTYRDAGTTDAALRELRHCSGSQFDPDVVDALCEVVAARRPAEPSSALTPRVAPVPA